MCKRCDKAAEQVLKQNTISVMDAELNHNARRPKLEELLVAGAMRLPEGSALRAIMLATGKNIHEHPEHQQDILDETERHLMRGLAELEDEVMGGIEVQVIFVGQKRPSSN